MARPDLDLAEPDFLEHRPEFDVCQAFGQSTQAQPEDGEPLDCTPGMRKIRGEQETAW
jgi:hypothetical protein